MGKKRLAILLIGLGSGFLVGGFLTTIFAERSGRGLKIKIADVAVNIADRINKFREPEKYSRIKP